MREGFTRDDDTLPARIFMQPLQGGPSEGWRLEKAQFSEALSEYYRQAGWAVDTGVPTRETLERLGLDWVADRL